MTQGVAPDSTHVATHIILLDLARFVAAILVMALHLGFWAWWKIGHDVGTIGRLFPRYPEYPELISFTWFGWVGVQIFFVISGFVITMSAERSSAMGFLRARFLRIYPVAWISATFSFFIVIVAAEQAMSGKLVLHYINTLVLSPYPAWIDGVYWTLVLELIFYSLVFLTIATGFLKRLVDAGIVLGFASTLYILGLASGSFTSGWIFTLILLRHGVFFSIGMLIWTLHPSNRRILWRNIVLLTVFSTMGIVEILHAAKTKLTALNLAAPLYPPVITWLVMICIIIASTIWPHPFNRRLFPARHILRLLGLATYPLYLIHQTVGGAMVAFAVRYGLGRGMALFVGVSTCIIVSVTIAILLEPVIRRLAARQFDAFFNGPVDISLRRR